MSPHDPQQVIFHGGLAAAHYLAGSYDEAINSALSVLRFRPTFNGARRLLVAALAQAGRLEEARKKLERLKDFSARYFVHVDREERALHARPNEELLGGLAQGWAPVTDLLRCLLGGQKTDLTARKSDSRFSSRRGLWAEAV